MRRIEIVEEPWTDRFWSKVEKTETCWLWAGGLTPYGRGRFHVARNNPRRAHYIAWELTNGPVPDGHELVPQCETLACVRPDHWELSVPPAVCLVEGCGGPIHGYGYCKRHNQQIRRTGSPGRTLPGPEVPLMDRIEKDLDKSTGCWVWTRKLNQAGYGLYKYQNRLHSLHRLVYEELVGPIPEGLELDHLCYVRNCCNPEHLEPVTGAENTRRAMAHKRAAALEALIGESDV